MEEHLAGQKILTANNKPICDDHILSKLLKSKLGEDNVLSVMRQGGDFAVEVPNNFSQQKLEDIQISTPYLRRVKKTPTTDIIYIPDKAFHIICKMMQSSCSGWKG